MKDHPEFDGMVDDALELCRGARNKAVVKDYLVGLCHSAVADTEDKLAEEKAIVDRIWKQLGTYTYQSLHGRSIYDLIDELIRFKQLALAYRDGHVGSAGQECYCDESGDFRCPLCKQMSALR
jgi:hypothetical protein